MKQTQITPSTTEQIIIGFSVGTLLLILSVQVLFPDIQIPFIGIIPAALSTIDFVVHEVGHMVFGFLGQYFSVLGGTLAQLFLPTVCILLSFRRKQWATTSIFLFWLGQSLVQISRYVMDAETQKLKLFSPGSIFGGPKPIHDWNYLLGKVGLLWADQIIGGTIFLAGLTFLICSAGLLFYRAIYIRRAITI
jgi:hypothetical protein